MCPVKPVAPGTAQPWSAYIYLPEEYPNIDVADGSLGKEVSDMKFKMIVFKFAVSRLGFYCACQTFSFFFLWVSYTNMDFICLLIEGSGDSATLYRCPSFPISTLLAQNTVGCDRSKTRRKGEYEGLLLGRASPLPLWSAALGAPDSCSLQSLSSSCCSIFVLFLF